MSLPIWLWSTSESYSKLVFSRRMPFFKARRCAAVQWYLLDAAKCSITSRMQVNEWAFPAERRRMSWTMRIGREEEKEEESATNGVMVMRIFTMMRLYVLDAQDAARPTSVFLLTDASPILGALLTPSPPPPVFLYVKIQFGRIRCFPWKGERGSARFSSGLFTRMHLQILARSLIPQICLQIFVSI